MAPLWIIGICFLAGWLLRRFKILPEDASRTLAGYIIYVALPALVLLHVHSLRLDGDLLFAALMPHGVFGLSFLIFRWLGHQLAWSRDTIICLTLTAGLGNTSFVGLPMIEAFFGEKHLGTGILIDQAGSFLCLSTSGLFLLMSQIKASPLSGRSGQGIGMTNEVVRTGHSPGGSKDANPADSGSGDENQKTFRSILLRIVRFPPFIALVMAVLLRWIEYSEVFTEILQSIGSTLTPVAMVAVGFQIRLQSLKEQGLPLFLGLSFRLILAPLVVALAALVFTVLSGSADSSGFFGFVALPSVLQITIFEAAMPPMITAGILCMEYDRNPDLAGLMLGVGIPLSFLSLPIVSLLLHL